MPWQSERVADMLLGFLQNWRDNGLKDSELDSWLERFELDKMAAATEFWQEIYRGQDEAFARGVQAVPDMLTPEQKKAAAHA